MPTSISNVNGNITSTTSGKVWTLHISVPNSQSMSTFSNQPSIEPGYIDTYANLLYKLGRKKEALKWEKKAQQIAISQGADKNWGQDVIDKINKGEKTWN